MALYFTEVLPLLKPLPPQAPSQKSSRYFPTLEIKLLAKHQREKSYEINVFFKDYSRSFHGSSKGYTSYPTATEKLLVTHELLERDSCFSISDEMSSDTQKLILEQILLIFSLLLQANMVTYLALSIV